MSEPRPNILLLLTDQQRFDALGVAGGDTLTPNLDRLAGEGTLFTHCCCNSPVCMPSRQSLMTGRYPADVGCTANGIELPEDTVTVAHRLGALGYRTANLGKLHFTNHATRDHTAHHPTYGFDELVLSDEPGCYDDAYIAWVRRRDPAAVEACRCSTPPAWRGEPVRKQPRRVVDPYVFEGPEALTHTAFVADRTADFIRRHRDAEPFFAVAGFYAPHSPINPPARFLDLYEPRALPAPVMNDGDRERFGLGDDAWRRIRQHYHALVSHVDDQVGTILQALEGGGLADRTVVIFTSDHGEYLGDHGRTDKGPPGHEPVLRVPLIVRDPRCPGGRVRDELVELIDLVPTMLDCAGAPVPRELPGRSLRGLLTGGAALDWRRSAYAEQREPGGEGWRMLRTRRHKYAVRHDGHELLYDLGRDPHELHDVARDPAAGEALAAMRAELIRRSFDTGAQPRSKTGPY